MLLTIALVVIFRAEYNPETFLFKQPEKRKENILRKNLKCTKDAFLQRIWIQTNRSHLIAVILF